MKICLLIISLLIYYNVIAQNKSINTLMKLNETWLNSFLTRDTSKLSTILDHDFTLIGANGNKQSRNDNLKNLLDTSIKFKSIKVDSIQINLLTPEVAILNCWTTFELYSGGKYFVGKNCYQDIYRRKNKLWRAISAHVTLLSLK